MPENNRIIKRANLPGRSSAFLRSCVQATIDEPERKLFHSRFGHLPPEEPIHVVTHYDRPDLASRPLCYLHFYDWQGCLLIGGVCVDQGLLRQMSRDERAVLRQAGGPYFWSLSAALEHFAGTTLAVFGYCGDPLSERITLSAGFCKTDCDHVLAWWSPRLPAAERPALLQKVRELGPF